MNTSPLKKAAKIFAIVIAIFLGLLSTLSIASDILLSPKVSKKLVSQGSSKFFAGQMSFSDASISVFRHFPKITMDMDSLVMTYPTESDTIAFFRKYSASVSALSMLRGVLKLDDIQLDHPRMYMHIASDGSSNWDSMKVDMGEKETKAEAKRRRKNHSFRLPRMGFRKMNLGNHAYIVYDDDQQDIHATLRMKEFVFDGKLTTTRFQKSEFVMSVDSLMAEGRMAGDTLRFDLDHFRVQSHRGDMDLDSRAVTLMATQRHGRIMVPFGMSGKILARNKLSGALSLDLSNMAVDVATVGLRTDMHLELDRKIKMKGNVHIPPIDVQKVLDDYIYQVLPEFRVLQTDMLFSAGIDVDGYYDPRRSSIPAFSASLDIPECFIRHSEFDFVPHLEFKTTLSGEQGGQIDAAVAKCHIRAPQILFDASGVVSDIRGADPLTDVTCKLDARLDSLGRVFEQHFDIRLGGGIKLDAKGKFNLSNIDKYNFANADLKADVDMDGLEVVSLDDDLDARIGTAQLRAALMDDRFRKDATDKDRSLAARLDLDDVKLRYGSIADIRGNRVSVLMQNSSDQVELNDTLRYHMLNVLLSVGKVAFKGKDGFKADLNGSETTLKLVPSPEDQTVPLIGIESGNELVNADFGGLKATMHNIDLSAKAEMTEAHRKKRLVTIMKDMQKLHPEMQPDSIWRFLRQNPHSPKLPHFAQASEHFRKTHQVDPAAALLTYLRRWDLQGDVTMGKTSFGSICMNDFDAKLRLMDRCLQLSEVKAATTAGSIFAEGFLSSASEDGRIHAGFDMDMRKLSAGELVRLVPHIDELAPVLNSFEGSFNCQFAATTAFDSKMNLVGPSLNGVLRLTGDNLHFNENKKVTRIARLLWVKNASHATIEHLKVEALLKDSAVEIFPFLIKLENWSAVAEGVQHLDGSFKYHVSLVHCPFGLKLGANIYGKSFDALKFKTGKAHYKDENIPSYSAKIDAVRSKLVGSIHEVFDTGALNAVDSHRRHGVDFDRPDVIKELETLSESEKKLLP